MKSPWSLTAAVLFAAEITSGQPNVLWRNLDRGQTSANLNETVLTTADVTTTQFGKLYSYPVSGGIYAQPLYVAGLNIPGKGTYNVLFIATMNDRVYAFDADSNTLLWTRDFTNPPSIIAPPVTSIASYIKNIVGNVGIEGTPVIDPSTSILYALARTEENGIFFQRLHALDLATGAEKFGGPVAIQASVKGTGADNSAGVVPFDAKNSNQRVSLSLTNGVVLIAWNGQEEAQHHGWIIGYNAATLAQVGALCVTPDGIAGGIWMAGRAPVIDSAGYAYFSTANGDWNGTRNFSETVLKLAVSTQGISIADWFTPSDWTTLNTDDLDLASTGPLMIPGQSTLVAGGKSGYFYLLNSGGLGHEQSGDTQAIQVINNSSGGDMKGGPVFWTSASKGPLMYNMSETDYLKAWHFNGVKFDPTPVMQSAVASPGSPGGTLWVSANGSTDGTGILWAMLAAVKNPNGDAGNVLGILRAFNATTLAEIWNSEQNSTRDRLGNLSKFAPPVVINSKVYAVTQDGSVAVYGLLPPPVNFTITAVNAAPTTDGALVTWTTSIATTSQVQYGLTTTYTNSTHLDNTLVTNHSVPIGDLACGTLYHYQVLSSAGNGSSALSSPDATFTTQPCLPAGSGPVSDDFNSASLNNSQWNFVNTLGDCSYSLNGSELTLKVPSGVVHNVWTTGIDGPHVMQPIGNGDFEAVTKMDSVVNAGKQMQGILVEQDGGTFVRFDLRHDGTSPRIFAATVSGTSWTIPIDTALSGVTAPFWLKVKRSGNTWTESYSSNGTTFTTSGSFNFTMNAHTIGLFAGNNSNSTTGVIPGLTAVFDYFHNTATVTQAPDLTVSKTHSGTFTAGGSGGYTITVTNNGSAPTSGAVSVSDNVPSGLTPASATGTGWSCTIGGAAVSCTRSDSLAAAASYPAITLNVNIASNSPGSVTNQVTVSGGGESNASNDTASDTATISGGTSAGSPVADDFNTATLNTAVWTFVNPVGNGSYSLSGTGLLLNVPGGTGHSPSVGGTNNSIRVIQPIGNVNFGLEAKFDTIPSQLYQMEGILVQQDANDYFRIEFYSDGKSPYLLVSTIVGGTTTTRANSAIALPGPSAWLRVARSGTTWTVTWSADGTSYKAGATFSQALTTAYGGLYAGNYNSTVSASPAFSAAADYFHTF